MWYPSRWKEEKDIKFWSLFFFAEMKNFWDVINYMSSYIKSLLKWNRVVCRLSWKTLEDVEETINIKDNKSKSC